MSTIFTDEAKLYDGVSYMKNPGYRHSWINRSEAMYVIGNVHTKTIGFLESGTTGLGGTHHMVSAKYRQNYLDEYSFRYTRRNEPMPMLMILSKVAERAE
jgi:hypothetical protein